MGKFVSDDSRESWEEILDSSVEIYNCDLLDREKIEFESQAKAFVRIYQFLVQIKSFINSDWESLKTFLQLLLNKLPKLDNYDLSEGVINSVDIDSYRIEFLASQSISLSGESILSAISDNIVTGNSETRSDKLSRIVAEFNYRFGGSISWQDKDKVWKFLLAELPKKVIANLEYQNTKNYSDRQNAKLTFEKKLAENFRSFMREHTEEYRQFVENSDFQEWLINSLFNLDNEKKNLLENSCIFDNFYD